MDTTRMRKLAAAALALTGLLHLVLVPEYLGEQAYIGVLFIGGGLSSLAIAAWLWTKDDSRAWVLGSLVAAGMAVGFILSRTIGLPGFQESEWELSGIISVLLEIGVLTLTLAAMRSPRAAVGKATA